jgi:hypothetical protein
MDVEAVALAPGAEENGLASMLASLLRQNLETKPHKLSDFRALWGTVAIFATDADVALTLRFRGGRVTLHDAIVGAPDVVVRATSDVIVAMSTAPLRTPLLLPVPDPRRPADRAYAKDLWAATRAGHLKVEGAALHLPLLLRLSRVLSVEG